MCVCLLAKFSPVGHWRHERSKAQQSAANAYAIDANTTTLLFVIHASQIMLFVGAKCEHARMRACVTRVLCTARVTLTWKRPAHATNRPADDV